MATKKTSAVVDTPGKDIAEIEDARSVSRMTGFTDAELRGITSFDDAFALATNVYGEVTDITQELGNGFTLISDKAPLVGKPFVILSCGFNEGDFGDFVSVAVVTESGEKYIFNDGSTGIFNQIFEMARLKNRTGGFLAPSGLTASEYETCPPADGGCSRGRPNAAKVCQHCGNESERRGMATTYYLNLAP